MFTRYTKIRMPYFKIYDPYSNQEKVLNTEEYKEYQDEQIVIITGSDGKQQIFTR